MVIEPLLATKEDTLAILTFWLPKQVTQEENKLDTLVP